MEATLAATSQSVLAATSSLKRVDRKVVIDDLSVSFDAHTAEPDSVSKYVKELDRCKKIMETVSRHTEYYQIHNACIRTFDIARVLLDSGLPNVAVPYLGFAIVMCECTLALASVRYLSFRVRLYGMMYRCLIASGHVAHAKKCMERCVQKIDWLDKLEHSDRIPPPKQTEDMIARARADVQKYLADDTPKREKAVEMAFREKSVDKLMAMPASPVTAVLIAALRCIPYLESLSSRDSVDSFSEPADKIGLVHEFASVLLLHASAVAETKARMVCELGLLLYKNFGKKLYTGYVQRRDALYKQHGLVDKVAGQDEAAHVMHAVAVCFITARCVDYVLAGQAILQAAAILSECKELRRSAQILAAGAGFLADSRARLLARSREAGEHDVVRPQMLVALQTECVEMINYVHIFLMKQPVQQVEALHKRDEFARVLCRCMGSNPTQYPLSLATWSKASENIARARFHGRRCIRVVVPSRYLQREDCRTVHVYWKKMPAVINVYEENLPVDLVDLRSRGLDFVDVYSRIEDNCEYVYAFRGDFERDLSKPEGTLFAADPLDPFAWQYAGLRRSIAYISFQNSNNVKGSREMLTFALESATAIDDPVLTLEITSKIYGSYVSVLGSRQKPPSIVKPFLMILTVISTVMPAWARYRPDVQRFVGKVAHELVLWCQQSEEVGCGKIVMDTMLRYIEGIPSYVARQRELDRWVATYVPEKVPSLPATSSNTLFGPVIEVEDMFKKRQYVDVLMKIPAISKMVKETFSKFNTESQLNITKGESQQSAGKVVWKALLALRKRISLRNARQDFVSNELPWRAKLEFLRCRAIEGIYDEKRRGIAPAESVAAKAAGAGAGAGSKDAKADKSKTKAAAPAQPDPSFVLPAESEMEKSLNRAVELSSRAKCHLMVFDYAMYGLQLQKTSRSICMAVIESLAYAQLDPNRSLLPLFTMLGDDELIERFHIAAGNRFRVLPDAPPSEVMLDRARRSKRREDYEVAIRIAREKHDMDSLIAGLYENANYEDCLDACFAQVSVLGTTKMVEDAKPVLREHLVYLMLAAGRHAYHESSVDRLITMCKLVSGALRRCFTYQVQTIADWMILTLVDVPPGVVLRDTKQLLYGCIALAQLLTVVDCALDAVPIIVFAEYVANVHLKNFDVASKLKSWKSDLTAKVTFETDLPVIEHLRRLDVAYIDLKRCLSDQRSSDFFPLAQGVLNSARALRYTEREQTALALLSYGTYIFDGTIQPDLLQYLPWSLMQNLPIKPEQVSQKDVQLKFLADIELLVLFERWDDVERLLHKETQVENIWRYGYAYVAALAMQRKYREAVLQRSRFLDRTAGLFARYSKASVDKWSFFARDAFRGNFAPKKPVPDPSDEVALLSPVVELLGVCNAVVRGSFHRRLLKWVCAELAFAYGTTPAMRYRARYYLLRAVLHANQETDLVAGGKEEDLAKALTGVDANEALKQAYCLTQSMREFRMCVTDCLPAPPPASELHQFFRSKCPAYESGFCSEAVPMDDRGGELGFLTSIWYVLNEDDRVLAKHARKMTALELKRREEQGHARLDYVQGTTLLMCCTEAADSSTLLSRMVALPDLQDLFWHVRAWRYAGIGNSPVKYQAVQEAVATCFGVELPVDEKWWNEKRLENFELWCDPERGAAWVDVDLLSMLVKLVR